MFSRDGQVGIGLELDENVRQCLMETSEAEKVIAAIREAIDSAKG